MKTRCMLCACWGWIRHPQIAIYKVGLTWPLETEGLRDFARGKRALFVIEEKRPFVEAQLRDALYHLPADARPEIIGKTDARGAPLLSPLMELSPESVAAALTKVLGNAGIAADQPARRLPRRCAPRNDDNRGSISPRSTIYRPAALLRRAPAFCAGCPHATSTKVPEGSFATGGIGCHIMALDAGDQTRTYVQMGGEGMPFVGMAPFTDTPHTFANLGDGTYQHSGILAIRQALAAHARITFKLLFNDAVAMTGGQPAEGAPTRACASPRSLPRRACSASPSWRTMPTGCRAPATCRPAPRAIRASELDAVQRELRDYDGVSVLIYDQVCATEKRRRRKRGSMAQAARHVVINQQVCENCGDCSTQSGCIAIEPVETDARPQAAHQPDKLQRRSVLPEGLLPQLRHHRRSARRAGYRSAMGSSGRTHWRAPCGQPTPADG